MKPSCRQILAALAALLLHPTPGAGQYMYYDSGAGRIVAPSLQSVGSLFSTTGAIYGGGSAYWAATGDWNYFFTAMGQVQLGPANSGWAHIYTYSNINFNMDVYVLGNQAVVNSGTWGISISGNAGTATSATDANTVDSLHAASFARKDASIQWIRPYYQWGNSVCSQAPSTLYSQIDSGLRVDFGCSGYITGDYAQVLTFIGIATNYSMPQIAGKYAGNQAVLYVRTENNGGDAWQSWRTVLSKIVTQISCRGNYSGCTPPVCPFPSTDLGVMVSGAMSFRHCCWGED